MIEIDDHGIFPVDERKVLSVISRIFEAPHFYRGYGRHLFHPQVCRLGTSSLSTLFKTNWRKTNHWHQSWGTTHPVSSIGFSSLPLWWYRAALIPLTWKKNSRKEPPGFRTNDFINLYFPPPICSQVMKATGPGHKPRHPSHQWPFLFNVFLKAGPAAGRSAKFKFNHL